MMSDMSRAKAIVTGAIAGASLGPFFGACVIAVAYGLLDPQFRLSATAWPIFFLPFGILIFGVPGAFAGALTAMLLHAAVPRFPSRFRFSLFAAISGAIVGAGLIGAVKLWSNNVAPGYIPATIIAGSVTSTMYSLWLYRKMRP